MAHPPTPAPPRALPPPQPPPQPPLPLPGPGLDDPAVLQAARRMFERSAYLQRCYGSLERALADAARARLLLICARRAWLSLQRPPRRR